MHCGPFRGHLLGGLHGDGVHVVDICDACRRLEIALGSFGFFLFVSFGVNVWEGVYMCMFFCCFYFIWDLGRNISYIEV